MCNVCWPASSSIIVAGVQSHLNREPLLNVVSSPTCPRNHTPPTLVKNSNRLQHNRFKTTKKPPLCSTPMKEAQHKWSRDDHRTEITGENRTDRSLSAVHQVRRPSTGGHKQNIQIRTMQQLPRFEQTKSNCLDADRQKSYAQIRRDKNYCLDWDRQNKMSNRRLKM